MRSQVLSGSGDPLRGGEKDRSGFKVLRLRAPDDVAVEAVLNIAETHLQVYLIFL